MHSVKTEAPVQKGRVFPFGKRVWRVAAACVAGLLLAGGYLLLRNESSPAVIVSRYKNDVQPGGDKATLTLGDGRTIALTASADKQLAKEGGVNISQAEGRLVYQLTGNTTQTVYNSIATPRGGQYRVQLSDGTEVWLNAGSKLHFPATLGGKERRVELTGEAYFEVAKNKQKPFIVSAKGSEVRVLGTHFSVSAYADDVAVKTTLLEGSVKVTSAKATKMLKPGQQSVAEKNGDVKLIDSIGTEEAVAWKNGAFVFEGAGIEAIMRQLSRWYDVDVVYNKRVTELFYAEIPRSTKLSEALKALELTGKVRFGIEGKNIIVEP